MIFELSGCIEWMMRRLTLLEHQVMPVQVHKVDTLVSYRAEAEI